MGVGSKNLKKSKCPTDIVNDPFMLCGKVRSALCANDSILTGLSEQPSPSRAEGSGQPHSDGRRKFALIALTCLAIVQAPTHA